jgi:hypothetical protein
MSSIRTELQPLAPAPPPLPDFTPSSLDPEWSTAIEAGAMKEISLVLYRRPGATWVDRFPLSTEMIMVSYRDSWHELIPIGQSIPSCIPGYCGKDP